MSHHKEEKPLEKMTVPELKELALTYPHDHLEKAVHDLHKDELLAFIKASQGIHDEPASVKKKAHAHKHKPAKTPMTKPELKARIVTLKEKRQEARGSNDRKLTARLRRQISRMKKKTRKIA
jgi:hypothetical protein